MKVKTVKKGDIILIAAAFITAAILFLCLNTFNGNRGDYVQIEVGGETAEMLSLDADTLYDIKTENGITNTLEISNGKAKMIYADCPDKICVNHKSISKNGEAIICLPNKVVVTVISDNEEIDGVAE